MTTPPPPPYPRSPDDVEPDKLDKEAGEPSPAAESVTAPASDNRRQRRLVIAAVVAAVVVVLGASAGISIGRDRVRVDDACRALEVRLNRVAPPGSAPGPRQRAVAIRNENAALQPFLDELSRVADRDRDGADDRMVALWTDLVEARTAYATALDRQAASGAPAFFVAPLSDRGNPVLDRLEDRHGDCAPSVRRLGAPDL
jgi:hypothetical protein